jgi:arylsulfatase A-like enzyme/Tfp pilus assembly protein PilF
MYGMKKWRLFISVSLVFVVFLLLGSPAPLSAIVKPEKTKKNILLITIDTLRADRLSCYSSDHVKTPNIDALAGKSTVFTRAFAHTSTTLPSHTNILLGMTPLYHGVHDNLNFKVGDEYLTLAEHLKKEGYATGAFVGAFPLDARFGLSQGFDTYDGDFGLTVSGKVVSAERPAEVVVNRALEWLNKQKSPWFLWVHCYDPHDPYEPPEPYRSQYKSSPYDGEVAYVDSVMEKLFQYLEDQNLMEKTVIAFTGDHGESLGEHGEITHGYLAYNSAIWIPMFLFNPGMKPQVIHQNVSHIDLFPTICDILNIERPTFLQGISLLPSMKGKKLGRRSIYFESLLPFYDLGWAPIRGLIQDHDKFIDSPIPELYDLEKDFAETKNLAKTNELDAYRKELNELIQIQKPEEGLESERKIDRTTLERLKSLGYVGDYLGDRKRTFRAEDDVKVLLPYHNKSVEAFKLWNEGKAYEGIELLKEIITEKKNISSAYSNLASIYKSQGRLIDAIQVLRLGLESLPDSYMIFSSYVDYLSEAGQWDEIISVFGAMTYNQLEFDPVIWNQVGAAYAKIGDFENAKQFCQRAVAIDDTFPISYSNLGMIHFNIFNLTTNPEELVSARKQYEKAIELDPQISAAQDGLGLVCLYQEDYEKAIHHFELAFQLQPDFNHVLYNLGVAHLKKGDKTKALSYFNKFKGSPSYPNLPAKEKLKVEYYIKQCQNIT